MQQPKEVPTKRPEHRSKDLESTPLKQKPDEGEEEHEQHEEDEERELSRVEMWTGNNLRRLI